MVFFYVDDVIILNLPKDRPPADALRKNLMARHIFKDIGELKWFLDIRIIGDRAQRKIW